MVRKNLITLILCVVLSFTTFFSFLFIATNTEHTHVGNACHTCLEIHTCISFLNSISSAGALSLLILGLLLFIYHRNCPTKDLRRFSTLVSLKVKLVI